MNQWSNERKRQYVLEQAIQETISHVRNVMRSLRWKVDGYEDDFEDRKMVDPEAALKAVNEAELSIVIQLDGLLRSVIMTYNKDVLPESNKP